MATKHSGREQRKTRRHGARHGAAQWLSPRRDLITCRDMAELTEHDYNAHGHRHVHLDSFWSCSCHAARVSPALSCACWMTMVLWRERDCYAKRVHGPSIRTSSTLAVQWHAWRRSLRVSVLFDVTDPYTYADVPWSVVRIAVWRGRQTAKSHCSPCILR